MNIDWEAGKGKFVAQTTYWDSNNNEIKLDHAANCIYVNDNKIWKGKDSRYRRVYQEFARRIQTKSSNIESGVFECAAIASVFNA